MFGVQLPAQNYRNVPDNDTATEVSFTDSDGTKMGNSKHLEGENVIIDEIMEGVKSKKQMPTGIKRGWKIKIYILLIQAKTLGLLDINQ